MSLLSCDLFRVQSVAIFAPPCGVSPVRLAVGDVMQLAARAYTAGLFWPGGYDSEAVPQKFRWGVAPDSLATVTANGALIPARPGLLQVTATADGMTGVLEVLIEQPLVNVQVDVSRDIVAGDTVDVRFTAVGVADSFVREPAGPVVWDYDETVLKRIHYHVPGHARFVAERSGSTVFRWCYDSRVGATPIMIQ